MKNVILSVVALLFSVNVISQTKSDGEVKGLMEGTQVQNFKAKTTTGEVFELSKALEKGNVVVVFYRGQWCPFCNRHMAALQDSLAQIQATGAQVVAISSEKPEVSSKIQEKTGAQFIFLYDEDYKISQMFDVLFLPNKSTRRMLNTMAKAKLKDNYADDSERLPVPATYLIDQNSVITWRHFDTDYKNRSTVKDIISNL